MSSAIIERFLITEKDKKALSQIVFDSKDTSDDFFDYSKVVVKKPWGYEYLIFKNESVESVHNPTPSKKIKRPLVDLSKDFILYLVKT